MTTPTIIITTRWRVPENSTIEHPCVGTVISA